MQFKTPPLQHQLACLIRFGRAPYFALGAEQGTGKAQPLNCKVLTPSGWSKIGDLKKGDKVFSANGSITKVTGIFKQGKKEVFEITLGDGGKTKSCKEHLWLTAHAMDRQRCKRKGGNPFSIKTLDHIRETIIDNSKICMHQLPVVSILKFPKIKVPIDPYTLGVLLGDGGLRTGINLTNQETFIIEKIRRALPSSMRITSERNNHRLNATKWRKNEYFKILNELGLIGCYSHNKFVPTQYQFNHPSITLPILQGLMDTDGTVENGMAVFSSTSRDLAVSLAEIARSLGGIARISEKKNCGYFKNKKKIPCRDGFVVRLNMPKNICPFTLPRKKNLWRPAKKYLPNQRTIRSIKPIGKEECVCISIRNKSGLYITDDHIVTHNTKIIIDNLADLWSTGDCDSAQIFAPNGVHYNWLLREIPLHMPEFVRYRAAAWCANPTRKDKQEMEKLFAERDPTVLRILLMNIESLQHERGIEAARAFAQSCKKLMLVADESSAFKNPRAERTKQLMKLKKFSLWRRIMNGTLITQGPFDAFSQYMFLDESILATTSYFAFKAEYAEMLPANHPLLQHIVEKKNAMPEADHERLRQTIVQLWQLLQANGREELIEMAQSIHLALENSSYGLLSDLALELSGMFDPANNSKDKTQAIELLAHIQATVDGHLTRVSRLAAVPHRLPQIPQKTKEGRPKYRNLEKLTKLIAPHTFRVLKKDCLDLPKKIYKYVWFDMTPEQRRIYDKAAIEFRLALNGEETPFSQLAAQMKLMQITSGYYLHPDQEEPVRIPGPNPKLELLTERALAVMEAEQKLIVWARFRVQIEDIVAALEKQGLNVVQYHGGVKKAARHEAIEAFERGSANVFVGQQQAGGKGLTLIAASNVFYFSNTFALEDRLHSEDRAHRIGQEEEVVYTDFCARDTIDYSCIETLHAKMDVAEKILAPLERQSR